MKHFSFSLFLLFASTCLSAQTNVKEKSSGFLGRKNTIGKRLLVSPNMSSDFIFMDFIDRVKNVSLNKTLAISLEHCLSNNASILANYKMSKSSIEYSSRFSNSFQHANSYQFIDVEGDYAQIYKVEGQPTMFISNIGGEIRNYINSRAAIAPLGYYYGLQFNARIATLDMSSVRYFANAEDNFDISRSKEYGHLQTKYTNAFWGINLTAGESIAITPRIIFNYGMELGYTQVPKNLDYNNADNISDFIPVLVKKKMKFRSFSNFVVGAKFSI
jgi:hypothetical protein